MNDLWLHVHAYTGIRYTVTENLNFTTGSKTHTIVTSLVSTNYSIIHANVQSFILKNSLIAKMKNSLLGPFSKNPSFNTIIGVGSSRYNGEESDLTDLNSYSKIAIC